MGFDINNIRSKVLNLRNLKDTVGELAQGNIGALLPSNPQKNYLWEVEIIGDTTNIKLFAKTVSIPQSTIDPILVNYMGETVHYAGKESSPKTITMTFWDDERSTILNYLDNWFTQIHENETGNMLSESDYRRTIKVILKDSTDLTSTSETTLSGAFIMDIAEAQLSYEGSDALELTATFQYELKDIEV